MFHAQIHWNVDNADRQLRMCDDILSVALILLLSCLSPQLAAQVRTTISCHPGVEIAYLSTTTLATKRLLEGRRDWLALQEAF